MALFTLGTPAAAGTGTLRYEQLTSEETVNTSAALPTSSLTPVSQLDDIKALQGSTTGAGNAPLIQTSPSGQGGAQAAADPSLAAALTGSTHAQLNQQALQGGAHSSAAAVPAVELASVPLDNQALPLEDSSLRLDDRFSGDAGQTTNIVINQPNGGGDNPQTPPPAATQPLVDVHVPTPVGDISISLDDTGLDVGLNPELPLIGELSLDTALDLPTLTPNSLDGLGQTLLDTLSGNADSPLLSLELGGHGITSNLAGFGEPGFTTTVLPEAISSVSNLVEQLPLAGPAAAGVLEPVQDLLSQPLVGLTVGQGAEDSTSLLEISLLDETADSASDLLDLSLGGDDTPDSAVLDISLDSGDEVGGLLDQIVESVADATSGVVDATPVSELSDEVIDSVLDTVNNTVNDIANTSGVTSTVDTVADTVASTVSSTTTSTVNTAVQQTITTITSPAIVPPVVTQPVQSLLHGFHL